VDTEAELAVVIGRAGRRLTEAKALDYVAGYTVVDDVTDREVQRAGKQWFRGKSGDTFCPMGPYLVTPDEAPDPHALAVTSRLNGQVVQQGHTRDMIFRIPVLLARLSESMTLEPGDVLATGTPAGIGSVCQPPLLLKPGDTVEVGVEGVGTQINPVVAEGS
jgi:2,4-didehydro-3-deoxy-L-rhamnonate hydrolase